MTDETDLLEVFDRRGIARLLRRPLVPGSGSVKGTRDYQLWSERPVVIEGRKRQEVHFVGVIAQKGHVGSASCPFIRTPSRRALRAGAPRPPEGKSCFHVKHLDDALPAHVEDALARGFELHRERGWVE